MTIKLKTTQEIKVELNSRLQEALDSKISCENAAITALKKDDYRDAALNTSNAYHYHRLAKTLECILYLIADE